MNKELELYIIYNGDCLYYNELDNQILFDWLDTEDFINLQKIKDNNWCYKKLSETNKSLLKIYLDDFIKFNNSKALNDIKLIENYLI